MTSTLNKSQTLLTVQKQTRFLSKPPKLYDNHFPKGQPDILKTGGQPAVAISNITATNWTSFLTYKSVHGMENKKLPIYQPIYWLFEKIISAIQLSSHNNVHIFKITRYILQYVLQNHNGLISWEIHLQLLKFPIYRPIFKMYRLISSMFGIPCLYSNHIILTFIHAPLFQLLLFLLLFLPCRNLFLYLNQKGGGYWLVAIELSQLILEPQDVGMHDTYALTTYSFTWTKKPVVEKCIHIIPVKPKTKGLAIEN